MARWGTKAPPFQFILLLSCTLSPIAWGLVVLSLFMPVLAPLPCTEPFHSLISCQIAWAHLDCLIRDSTETPRSNYLRAASRPEIDASKVLSDAPRTSWVTEYNAAPYTAFDSKKGRGKFLLQGSICCLYIYFRKSSNNKLLSKVPRRREVWGREGQCLQHSS